MAERTIAWKPRGENQIIGTEVLRIDGVEKASGTAKYSADINTQGTLYCKLLTCKHAHAKVTKLDTEPAKGVKGVKAVHIFRDVDSEIEWDGTLIAAVAAETQDAAQDGVNAIVVEYEVLPHFVDEDDLEAAKEAGRTTEPRSSTQGNVEAALKDAKAKVEGYYGIHTITHCCLEPHGSHCEFEDDNLIAHLSTQNVSGTPGQFAGPLGLDASKVTVVCDYIGGGFGSKFAADEWGLAAAKMAKETGRPVRLMLDRATELKTAGNRPSGFARVTIAANADGNIIAWDSEHWGTNGPQGGTVDVNQYPYVFDFENRNRAAIGIKTNAGPQRAWRAPNHPQLCAMTQTAMDDLAAELGMDSLDFFLKNLGHTAKADVYKAELERAAELIGWKDKWHAHGKGEKRRGKARGLGLGLHRWGGRAHAASCTVRIEPDGSVSSNAGSQDIGTGTRTVIAIVLAETFGLPVEAIKVNIGSSTLPQSGPSGGSTTVGGVSGPNRRAALEALWKIFDLVAAKYKVDAATLSAHGGKILSNGEKAVCTWKQAASLTGPMGLEVQGKGPENDGLTSDGVGGVQMAEVEVDLETGVVRMIKMVAVQDCGLIIDLKTAKSQVEGAMIQGIAYALTEERIMDNQTGRFINADLENYKLPRIGDVGELVAEMYQPDSEYARGVIGLGEPPVICCGAAISNAVANATGVRVSVLPMTPKRVLDALKKGGQA
ncbi:MAG: xanthine dehydrogenase family protein molybdopterin-binding subunit [Planctomycetes bacterium]|nr:xanthine dehydrogenase family protein molybdopterin-binding subunit [Planctomycetota bacterium]